MLAQDEELRSVAREVLLETMRDPNAKQSDRLAAARALYSYGPTKPPALASGAEDVTGGYVRHDPVRILAMLGEVGLVAPALVGQELRPRSPAQARQLITQAVMDQPECGRRSMRLRRA